MYDLWTVAFIYTINVTKWLWSTKGDVDYDVLFSVLVHVLSTEWFCKPGHVWTLNYTRDTSALFRKEAPGISDSMLSVDACTE